MTSEVGRVTSFNMKRRQFCILPLVFLADQLLAADTSSTPIPSTLPPGACPLNSGGPSLLGSRWRLMSVYDNTVPPQLRMTMEVKQTSMAGLGGCNNYTANFMQVGNRGFKVVNIQKTNTPCEVIRPGERLPTIDTGSWEGNYLKVLRRAGSVQQQGALLQFYDFNGKPSLVFAKVYGSRVPTPTPAS